MKRVFGWTIGGLAVAAVVYAQSGSSVLQAFVKTVNDAPAISAEFMTQVVGGSPSNYRIDLAKPDKVRIDSPATLIVADGNTVTTLDKSSNTYFKTPQTSKSLSEIFANEDLSVWEAFFNAKAFAKVASAKDKGEKVIGGVKFKVVEVVKDAQGRITQTLYFDDKNLVKRAQGEIKDPNGNATSLMIAKSVEVRAYKESDFAFAPPNGSREVSMEEMTSAMWYHDLEEAKSVAAKTNRKIFVDFMATWCGPCKKLDAEVLQTEGFKAYSKYFVFLKIDVDAQKNVAKAYNITAMPTQMVLAADGSVIGTTVGYGSPAGFYSFIDKYK